MLSGESLLSRRSKYYFKEKVGDKVKLILIILFLLLVFLISYMVYLAFGNNVLVHLIKTSGIQETYNVFFISDTHNRLIHSSVIERIQGNVNCIIIGGDFVDHRTSLNKIEENLKLLTAVAPTYFVWGNNDREIPEEQFIPLLTKYNVQIINNDSMLIHDGRNKIRLCAIDIKGTDEMIVQSIQKCEEDEHILFVSHDPHHFKKVINYITPLLLLGGHIHGGQIRLGRFGFFQKGSFGPFYGTYQLISNGYGTTLVPLRLGAKAESHIIQIHFQKIKR